MSKKTYIHRGGRCGRNGEYGVYFNLVQKDELPYLFDANINCGGLF